MVALRGRDIDVFLNKPDPGRPIILLYGPDAGLVRERADALMASAVDDPSDPFSSVRLDGDELAAEPSRLVDEAMTIPMFGGRRAIRVRAGSRSFAGGVDTLSEMPIKDCRIVIEAGELRPESPLRKACERAKTAVAIGCYPDGERDLAKLIDDEMKASNLRIAPDARAVLTALLDGLYAAGSALVVIPMPDAYGGDERIDVPATVGASNWGYRLPWTVDELLGSDGATLCERLRSLAERHGR